MGTMGSSGVDGIVHVIFDHELDGQGLDFDLMVPGDMIEDLRYLMSEMNHDDILWDEVKDILLRVPGISPREKRCLQEYHLSDLQIDGGW